MLLSMMALQCLPEEGQLQQQLVPSRVSEQRVHHRGPMTHGGVLAESWGGLVQVVCSSMRVPAGEALGAWVQNQRKHVTLNCSVTCLAERKDQKFPLVSTSGDKSIRKSFQPSPMNKNMSEGNIL